MWLSAAALAYFKPDDRAATTNYGYFFLAGNAGLIGGGEVLSAGERGNLTQTRDYELAQAEGAADTVRHTQQGDVTAGAQVAESAYQRDGQQQEALGQTWQGNETVQTAEWAAGAACAPARIRALHGIGYRRCIPVMGRCCRIAGCRVRFGQPLQGNPSAGSIVGVGREFQSGV